SFSEYVDGIRTTSQKGYWANAEAYSVNLLKAWWGDAATAENDWAYDYIPRINGAHGTYQTLMSMLKNQVEGYFLLG
ncbi:formate dehydrogenase, partial [Mycobacterium tuberculosis]|nr:formate dehydrogenase [Mycobacterium tuberculosis]